MNRRLHRERLLAALAALVALGGACGARSAVVPVPTVVLPATPPAALPAHEPADNPNVSLAGRVCHGREGCSIKKTHDAGKDAAGRELLVALVATGERRPEDATDDPPCPDGDTSCQAISYEANGEVFDFRSFESCALYEYWRVVKDGAGIVSVDRIDEVCNDGHGAAGVGEDSVKIGPNSFEHATSGGSAWRWSETRKLSLSPFQLRGIEQQGFWNVGPNLEESKTDWTTLESSLRWFSPACDENGDPPNLPLEFSVDETNEFAYVPIPFVALDEGFRTSGWKTTRLGSCAAAIDASGDRGYVVSGKASTARDASLRALFTGGELFVEVRDDHFVGPTAQANSDDHLEVWIAGPLPSYMDHCLAPESAPSMKSWNVRVADGKVTAGAGKPPASALSAERAADADGAVRFRLRLQEAATSITIAYADNDGGKKIARRIATSRLREHVAASLGGYLTTSGFATCAVKDGSLAVQLADAPLPQ